jgi:3-oxoadipate enol-lactonase
MPRVRVNGVELYYEVHGPKQARDTIVFANGVLGNTAGWLNQTMLFSKKYRVLLYDCRNQGRSEKPNVDCTIEAHAHDLDSLLECLHIEQAHIVGISYGGEIGMALALHRPERVNSLVISNSVSQIDATLEAKIEAWLMAAQMRDARLFFQITTPDIFSERFISQNAALMRLIEEQYAKLDYDSVIHLLARFREFNLTDQLSCIETPTLVLASADDTLKPLKYSHLIHQQIKGSELFVVRNSGHALTYEKPQEFNTLVLGFLEKQTLVAQEVTL